MSSPEKVSRNDWLKARKALLADEKKLTQKIDQLSAARRKMPAVKIDTDYEFTSEEGTISFKGLFGNARQLIVYHFMYAPDWDEGCTSCSFWADSFNGAHEHLAARDTAFACVSNAPVSELMAYKKRLGWWFPWVSAEGTTFGEDFGVTFHDGPADAYPEGYNYSGTAPVGERHGLSVFLLDDNGDILHTYSTYGRGIEVFNATYGLLDLTPRGRDEDELSFTMSWLKRRDCYCHGNPSP